MEIREKTVFTEEHLISHFQETQETMSKAAVET